MGELFASSLTQRTKSKGLLEIVSNASEFENIPMRRREDRALSQMVKHMPIKVDASTINEPHTKAHLLLQSHFARANLTPDLAADRRDIVDRSLRLLQACVDVISSNGWLGPALQAMELSQ